LDDIAFECELIRDLFVVVDHQCIQARGIEVGHKVWLRPADRCQYAVVELASAEERLKALVIHHDEEISDKFTLEGDVVQVLSDGVTPLYNSRGEFLLTRAVVQVELRPYRQRRDNTA
jgi:hypothetical protein